MAAVDGQIAGENKQERDGCANARDERIRMGIMYVQFILMKPHYVPVAAVIIRFVRITLEHMSVYSRHELAVYSFCFLLEFFFLSIFVALPSES